MSDSRKEIKVWNIKPKGNSEYLLSIIKFSNQNIIIDFLASTYIICRVSVNTDFHDIYRNTNYWSYFVA
jgi:hypothetical protein